jgi:hypothetical protein
MNHAHVTKSKCRTMIRFTSPIAASRAAQGVARRHDRRLRNVLHDDFRQIAEHPTAPQHHRGNGEVNDRRLDHYETRALGQHRSTHPLRRLDPPGLPNAGKLRDTGGDGDGGGKQVARERVDH